MKQFVRAGVLTIAFGLLGSSAMANTITVGPSPIISLNAIGPWDWEYLVSLEGDSQINNGDFFTIFDFDGYVAGSQEVVAGWNQTVQNTGLCPAQSPFPALCAVADDPTIPNLTWTRTGGVILGPGVGGSLNLGGFSATSIYNIPTNDFWVSQDQDNQTDPPTPNEGAGGNTNVPTANAIPEPATLLLLGSGLAAVARARQKKAARA